MGCEFGCVVFSACRRSLPRLRRRHIAAPAGLGFRSSQRQRRGAAIIAWLREGVVGGAVRWSQRRVGAREVLLVTPPAVDVEALASQPWYHADGRDAERTETYARAVMELAAANGYPAFNLYATMLGEGDGWQRLLRDGLHLSGQGNALLFAGLQAIISTHPRLRLRQREMLPTHLPVDPVKLADALNRTRVDCAWPGKVAGQTWFC